jgi:Sulfotransferase domain
VARSLIVTTTIFTHLVKLTNKYFGSVYVEFIENSQNSSPEFGNKMQRNLPDFLIIGVKKCGTRALLEFVNMHPDVEEKKEQDFFSTDSLHSKGLDWYR